MGAGGAGFGAGFGAGAGSAAGAGGGGVGGGSGGLGAATSVNATGIVLGLSNRLGRQRRRRHEDAVKRDASDVDQAVATLTHAAR